MKEVSKVAITLGGIASGFVGFFMMVPFGSDRYGSHPTMGMFCLFLAMLFLVVAVAEDR
jgi:hypothetical protein